MMVPLDQLDNPTEGGSRPFHFSLNENVDLNYKQTGFMEQQNSAPTDQSHNKVRETVRIKPSEPPNCDWPFKS